MKPALPLDPIEITKRLVSIPSVNPMGQEVSGPEFGEGRLTEFLETFFQSLGFTCLRQKIEPGRENLIARLDGEPAPGGEPSPESGGPIVLFDGHQDTVPVEGMTIDPFKPEIRDGKLFGRGACDTKGPMAAMLATAARLAKERPAGMPTLVFCFPINEEFGFTGVRQVSRIWDTTEPERAFAEKTYPFLPRRPDMAIIGEPTNLDVMVAHKGAVRWRCRTRGSAAHSSRPETGVNAIYKMAPVLKTLERYQEEADTLIPGHPLCGSATLSVGTIHGGVGVNLVPDECVIEIDRRVPPGEKGEDAYSHVQAYLKKHLPADIQVEHDPPMNVLPSLSDKHNGPLAERLLKTVRLTTGCGKRVGAQFGTHAAVYAEWDIPSVVCGPGSIEQAHQAVEWIEVESLCQGAEVYYRFVKSMCRDDS